ncbi:MAG TPA: OmpH family outer membrane protein [Thermodesulfobacteriota bacterium]|nr:OmpH family outer membrane protein [Thermodesulfobacteriota bacterium]
MKTIKATGLLFLALLFFVAPAGAAELKIAYANLQKALNECEAGMKAKDTLKEEAKKLEDELNAKQEELKKLRAEIDKKGSVWNKDTKDAKEADFKNKSQEFQKKYMEYGEQLNKKKQDTESDIIDELRGVVEEIAQKKGYTYVFERSVGGLLVAPASDDLTDEVIKQYNKEFRAKKH